jgi:hypothetical protein
MKGMLSFLVDNIYVVFGDLAFLWALIGLLYWQICSHIHMAQNLFRNCYGIITKKKLAVSFSYTFKYIDDVLSTNNMTSYQSGDLRGRVIKTWVLYNETSHLQLASVRILLRPM